MRKYILLLSLISLSFTFQSDNTSGWYQIAMPRTDVTVQDIFFNDSLTGFVLTKKNTTDSTYIIKTTNAGINWNTVYSDSSLLTRIQFVNTSLGYSSGYYNGFAGLFKTTNNGNNWFLVSYRMLDLGGLEDMFFVNKDTGWVCDASSLGGGLAKTTNGGVNWQMQLNQTFTPSKLFFINQDTGWAVCNSRRIYRTTNGGVNWDLLHISSNTIINFSFFDQSIGWMISGPQQTPLARTTDGGFNWKKYPDPVFINSGMQEIQLLKNNKGWIPTITRGIYSLVNDTLWGVQSSASNTHQYYSIFMTDTSKGYAGGDILLKTDDGGGVITGINSQEEEIASNYKLHQNYPNPFNPITRINYELKITNYVTLKIYDLQGKEIQTLVNKKQNAGNYSVGFNATNLSSGIYFYILQINNGKEVYTDTKKMILVK